MRLRHMHLRELTLMQHSDLVIGIPDWSLDRYPFPRSGFPSLAALKAAWFAHREELLAEGAAQGKRPWAARFDDENGNRR